MRQSRISRCYKRPAAKAQEFPGFAGAAQSDRGPRPSASREPALWANSTHETLIQTLAASLAALLLRVKQCPAFRAALLLKASGPIGLGTGAHRITPG